jgi:hypothetical protein
MDQSVDNIIKGIEKGANKAKVPEHSKDDDDDDDNTSGHASQKKYRVEGDEITAIRLVLLTYEV